MLDFSRSGPSFIASGSAHVAHGLVIKYRAKTTDFDGEPSNRNTRLGPQLLVTLLLPHSAARHGLHRIRAFAPMADLRHTLII